MKSSRGVNLLGGCKELKGPEHGTGCEGIKEAEWSQSGDLANRSPGEDVKRKGELGTDQGIFYVDRYHRPKG